MKRNLPLFWLMQLWIAITLSGCDERVYRLYEYDDQRERNAPVVSFCIPAGYLRQMFSSSEVVTTIAVAYEHQSLSPWSRKTSPESLITLDIQPKHGKTYKRPSSPAPASNALAYPGISPPVYIVERPPQGSPFVNRPALPGIVSPHLSLVPFDVGLRDKYEIDCSSNDAEGRREYCWIRFDSSDGFPLILGANTSALTEIEKLAFDAERLEQVPCILLREFQPAGRRAAQGDMRLGAEIVDFGRPDLLHQPDQVGGVRHVAIVQQERHVAGMPILIEVIDTVRVEKRCPAFDAMDDIAFLQQQFRKISPILTCHPRD